jgi:hypothetical protein
LSGSEELALLGLDLDALFVMTTAGRLARVNSPDRESAPRLVFAGCRSGVLARLRHDIGETVAREVADVVRGEPPWFDPEAPPRCLPALVAALSRERPVETIVQGRVWILPRSLSHHASAKLVNGDETEGMALLDRLAREGPPEALAAAGFRGPGDFWAPWCVALVDGVIAATAFAARLGEAAAEVGVHTFPGFRGRGLAAAVTARWSALPALGERRLFYSTQTTNLSSRRVAERLGLTPLGSTVSVT